MIMYCEFEKVNSKSAQMSELCNLLLPCVLISQEPIVYCTTYYLQFSFMKTRDPIFCGFHGKINPHGMFNSRTLKKLVNQ